MPGRRRILQEAKASGKAWGYADVKTTCSKDKAVSSSWLTDRTHTLYPSGYFCVLKSKPLLSFLSLFGGGDSGLRVGLAAQIDTRNQFVAATQSIVHPLPANLHIA